MPTLLKLCRGRLEMSVAGAPTAVWSVRVRSRKSHDFRYLTRLKLSNCLRVVLVFQGIGHPKCLTALPAMGNAVKGF